MPLPMNRRAALAAIGLSLAVSTAACRSHTSGPPEPKYSQWEQQLQTEFGRRPDTLPLKWRGVVRGITADTNNPWVLLLRGRPPNIPLPHGDYLAPAVHNHPGVPSALPTALVAG